MTLGSRMTIECPVCGGEGAVRRIHRFRISGTPGYPICSDICDECCGTGRVIIGPFAAPGMSRKTLLVALIAAAVIYGLAILTWVMLR